MTPGEFDRLAENPDLEVLCLAVHDETGDMEAEVGSDALTRPQLTVYCVEVFFGLTCNGGFESLFNGAYRWTVPHAVEALRRVGLDQYASTLEAAIAHLFPEGVPSDKDVYDDAVESIYDAFEESELADRFEDPFEVHEGPFWARYSADEAEFRQKLHAYIVTNRDGFTVA
jgi:hypothetical protein